MVAERYTDEKGNVWFIKPDGTKAIIKAVLSPEEKQTLVDQINAQTAKIVADRKEARMQAIADDLSYIKNHVGRQ